MAVEGGMARLLPYSGASPDVRDSHGRLRRSGTQ